MSADLHQARAELTAWSHRLEASLVQRTEELNRTQRHVVHMEKMASLGKLAATVAHELNNPLAGILNYAKLVGRSIREAGLPEDERQELLRCLGLIHKEAGRCGDIVRNLLLFARQSGGEPALVSLSAAIDSALMLVRHHMEMTNVELETSLLAADRDRVVCDSNQIEQALVALMVNAIEAMPAGGRLSVRALDRGESVDIEIEDTGSGIAPEVLPHIFEPFFSTKDKAEGVGLGLSVAYGIVQRHGGDIEVDSRVGRGTRFTITLPRRPVGSPNAGGEDEHGRREPQVASRGIDRR
jgi:two-component system NtrC family sensor kinase